MKRIFKNKFIACIIAAAVALLAAVFACFSINKNDITVKAEEATPVTEKIYWDLSGASNNLTLTLSNSFINSVNNYFSGTVAMNSDVLPWNSNRTNITNVVIRDKIAPKYMNAWFYNLNVTTLDLSNINTSNVTTFQSMCEGCTQLQSINMTGWDTSNAERMSFMFYSTNLSSLDLSHFNADKVTMITGMFGGCNFTGDLKLSDSLVTCLKNSTYDVGLSFPLYQYSIYNCSIEYTSLSGLTGGGTYSYVSREHNWELTSSTPAGCGTEGVTNYKCSICHETKTETIPATGNHTPGDAATCTTPQTCTVCIAELVPAKGHTPGEWIEDKAATCAEAGTKHKECTVCQIELETGTIDKVDHTAGDWVVDKAATCAEAGTKHKECTVCHIELETGTIPATGDHNWGSWTNNGNATNHTRSCQNAGCSETETQSHSFPETWVIDNEATEEAAGSKHRDCTVCNYRQTQTITQLTHTHKYDNWTEEEPASCTEAGTKGHYTCTCGLHFDENHNEISDLTIAAKEHSFNDWHQTKQATEEEEGEQQRECQREECDEVETKSIPKLNHVHTEVIDEAVDPTCTTEGKTEGKHCSGCNTVLVAQQTIPALGHDWSTEWSKDETNHWHECSRCTNKNDEAAHTYEWVITKEATTDEEGLMENLCSECGDKDGEQEIAKLVDPNGEIDLPVDINVEFKVTQSSTDNDYADIDKGLKRGYWAQLWYRNDDGTLGDEFTDKINCFLTLKIPVEIIEAIRGGDEINRDKIAEGLKVYFVNEAGAPVEVENFEIAMRDDDSWQIKFNYNEKFRAEVVFAADVAETPAEPKAGIPWWVWLLVVIGCLTVVGVVIVIIVVIKKKNGGGDGGAVVTAYDDAELKAKLSAQDKKLDEIKEIVDGGFNDVVDGE